MPADYTYQTVGFHFAVSFNNISGFDTIDARFQSVSGLDVKIETETLKEGGENRFEHVMPTRKKYSNLILKRGLLSPEAGSQITQWCLNAFQQYDQNGANAPRRMQIEPINLDIVLLNEKHETMLKWKVIHAWPVSWKFGELNAEKSEVLLETLELNYNRFEFTTS